MQDQADELRTLMLKAARRQAAAAGPGPRLAVVSGGKGGVGATTLAVHLSVALAHQAARVVLVDANPYRADVASLCGLEESANVGDVLTGRRDIHEVLQRGPAGIQVVPGVWAPDEPADFGSTPMRRLLMQLAALGRHADIVLIDVGGGTGDAMRGFWQAADEIVLVTTTQQVAVMDTYATIKSLLPLQASPAMRLVVNQATSTEAADVHQRIDQSCRRFLNLDIELLGHVPTSGAMSDAPPAELPSEQFETMAHRLTVNGNKSTGAKATAVA